MSQLAINHQGHLFSIDPTENDYLPPWFMEFATREEAERTLSQSAGNVLMRSHKSFLSTGKYVITYRKETGSFRHYLLLNTPDGFLLEIDNKNNHPVSCLSEALDLFSKLAGRAVQPIKCEHVSSNLGSSTGPVRTSHNYINTPQTSSVLNNTVPSRTEQLSGGQPIHNYLNVPKLSAASNHSTNFTDEVFRQNQNTKEPRSYVNMQQLCPSEDTYGARAGFKGQPMTAYEDFPQNTAPSPPPPPPPEWN